MLASVLCRRLTGGEDLLEARGVVEKTIDAEAHVRLLGRCLADDGAVLVHLLHDREDEELVRA